MKCGHSDCFTCPFPDCIGEPSAPKSKSGRKPLSPEERAERRRLYCREYYKNNPDKFHERYMKKSEGTVKKRYKDYKKRKMSNYGYLLSLDQEALGHYLCSIMDEKTEASCSGCPMLDRCGKNHNGWIDWLGELHNDVL